MQTTTETVSNNSFKTAIKCAVEEFGPEFGRQCVQLNSVAAIVAAIRARIGGLNQDRTYTVDRRGVVGPVEIC